MTEGRSSVTNVVVAGLGGQGVIKASDLLAEAAFRAGFDVKKAEVHGMSQRGGSVTSDVRFGREVLSPMVPAGEADYLVVLAADQIEVCRGALRPGGTVVAPDALAGCELPHPKSLNVALLGVLSRRLEAAGGAIPPAAWNDALDHLIDDRFREVNRRAFELGRAAAACP